MKKILPYVLSCLMLLGASCAEDDAPVGGPDEGEADPAGGGA